MAQSETYVEYARDGRIIKGQEKPVIKSSYEEDVLINNHTSVWGSFWQHGNWGYKCCHSFIKNSYCVGESGKYGEPLTSRKAYKESSGKDESSDSDEDTIRPKDRKVVEPEISKKSDSEDNNDESSKKVEKVERIPTESSESSSSESEIEEKKSSKSKKKDKKRSKKKKQKEKRKQKKQKEEDKLKLALRAEEEHNKRVEKLMKMDERKRPYNSMYEVKAPTEEEMEAFMIKRAREDDPMLQFAKK